LARENFALLPKKEQKIHGEPVEPSEAPQGADFGNILTIELSGILYSCGTRSMLSLAFKANASLAKVCTVTLAFSESSSREIVC